MQDIFHRSFLHDISQRYDRKSFAEGGNFSGRADITDKKISCHVPHSGRKHASAGRHARCSDIRAFSAMGRGGRQTREGYLPEAGRKNACSLSERKNMRLMERIFFLIHHKKRKQGEKSGLLSCFPAKKYTFPPCLYTDIPA
ncbi:hypothetical protein [uncultured Mailhella sp.]|uniref:hypothetical protein n=1 Tax=uncultured Mailhella sp. TaxID=1981031 RepID=UPI0025F8AA59|nr:hypothetical protein [uncultured Mailhella sp.]